MATFGEDNNDAILVFTDSLNEPGDVLASIAEFLFVVGEDGVEASAFSLLVGQLFFEGGDVGLKDRLGDFPVGVEFVQILVGIFQQFFKNHGSLIDGELRFTILFSHSSG